MLVAQHLATTHGRELDIATAKAAAVFTALKFKATDKGTTAASIFASESLPTQLGATIDAHWDSIGDTVPDDVVTAARAALDVDNTIDLALFGRMLAEIPVGGRIDGAVGVSHAFSVDPQAIEPDFFTAVDDAAPEGEAASGNLGVVQIAAPVLYRTAYLDRAQLRRNLAAAPDPERLAADAETAFIDWFIRAVPDSKQRSTVAATLPSLVVAVTGPQVLSAADAFADAVRSDNVVATATTRLVDAVTRHANFVPGITVERLARAADLPAAVADGAHTRSADFIAAVRAA
ncbi:CRISPR-associated protein, Cse4 family (plasmid) [Rhodococcus sp. WAY2]|nr:CRISPR-associated protein, Cse4 family [Rhodococcus sp. WAY2]